ncbi:aldo/keto reductase [Gottfriedia acidiceleris]|uniref:aldo/keto reductase n=1 Tax=Gottfriedia acidiceleris TaxID=371036 RepID=UPI001F42754A|nr:aldo/keto reductase [Gottfriedia acidiceleris]
MINKTYKLSTDVEIPILGLGTCLLDDTQAAQAVRDAVSIGYRHIDTAQAYRMQLV